VKGRRSFRLSKPYLVDLRFSSAVLVAWFRRRYAEDLSFRPRLIFSGIHARRQGFRLAGLMCTAALSGLRVGRKRSSPRDTDHLIGLRLDQYVRIPGGVKAGRNFRTVPGIETPVLESRPYSGSEEFFRDPRRHDRPRDRVVVGRNRERVAPCRKTRFAGR
jgi:hypothetical protein